MVLCLYNVDTLNICMKEFGLEKIIFVSTDSTDIFFSKLRSAGLNYNMLSFSLTLTVRGVSNKHCLLTFFIFDCSSSLYLEVMRTTIKSRMGSKLGKIRSGTEELAALEHLGKTP